ncbi:hypothetical protein J4G43_010965 [Bradyrhizobium barranii subsp. barranii]|uniref:Uncharacterized protein n=1 Tax=Bradyrhizobium barranii subsp. barranii TaxID=2823807 RepID=A0A939M2M8_9BRAD|nr:hypothetical protein [Bradyrhizobium barranii]UEM14713.1 hypothetical protein J4G43_010965 [Bradyrhizobium barranii subsp. barranii]
MLHDTCGSAPVETAGQPRLCPLQAALAARPCVESYDEFSRVALSLFRFIGAAYATGASDCWEAAYRFADEAELMRLLAVARRNQPGELESIVCQFVGNENEIATTRAVNALALC